MAQRAPKSSMPAPPLENAASQMLRSLGLEEVDPELVFELQKKEGAGAFGRVFRACYRSDPGRLAALKVIPVALEAGQRGEDVESVRREIQFLRECDHPNVVAFYGAYYKDGALWVAMEYCGGGSVGDVSRARRLAEPEIAVIMRGALRGLAYLHSKKKIHRDIKGGNILLTASGQVKIADFGVSAQLRDTMSRRGTFVGTPYWMSPEMIQDSDYDYKSDIWSLGITAIELADQKPPLFDEHPMRVLIQIPRNPSPQLQTPSAWTPLFSQFLQFCLEKDPLERPTALECLGHAFVRAVDHIERVFAAGGSETKADADAVAGGGGDVVASSARSSDPPAAVPPPQKASAECDDGDGIAEDIARLDDDDSESDGEQSESGETQSNEMPTGTFALDAASDSSSNDDYDARSRSSSSSNSSADEVGSSSRAAAESFQFRQPAAASGAAAQRESVAMISGDELLQLSVSESFELPVDAKRNALYAAAVQSATTTRGASPQRSAPEAAAAPPTIAAAKATTRSSSSTEFKLLPSKSTSPRTDRKPTGGDSRHASERLAAPTSAAFSVADDTPSSMRIKRTPSVAAAAPADRELQRAPPKQQSVVTTTPKNLASVSSSWQNPLADIETSASHPRVNVLLNSLNLSSSLSTRMFTQLLRDEEHERAAAERNTVDSSFATPQGTLGEAGELQPAPPAAVTSPPAPRRHARTSLTGAASSTHSISSPFRVAHNLSVTFNSVDARFEGAPASEEWAALHRQFGLPLAQMRCGSDQRGVPALLHMLRRELLKRDGLTTKHIYRLSPERTEVQSVKAAIDRGSVDHARVSDPHVYASLIKQWFRELPTPLLAALSIDDLSSVASGGGAGPASVECVLAKLPLQERVVFEWLLEHMLEVVDKSHVNKMTAPSIAVVLAPNLFSCESLSKTPSGASHAAARVADFLCALLEWKQMSRRGRRSSSSSATLSSANRSLLLAVGSSSAAAAAAGPGSSSLSASGSSTAATPSGLETATRSLHDTSLPDKSSSDQSRLQLRPLSDADQPLDAALGLAVDGVWRELEGQGIRSPDNAKNELGECFERFQHSVLKLVASTSKRGEERDWAEATLARLASGAGVQTAVTIPSSLGRVRRWVAAALSADEFARLLQSERATKDKLERLRKRFPMGERASSAGAARGDCKQHSVGIEAIHDLFRQIGVASTLLTNASARHGVQESSTSAGEEQDSSGGGDLLLEGALQLAQLAADSAEEHESERLMRAAQAIAQRAKHEPASGNLLAGLGNNALVTHLELDESQAQLLTTVEAALRIHPLLQH